MSIVSFAFVGVVFIFFSVIFKIVNPLPNFFKRIASKSILFKTTLYTWLSFSIEESTRINPTSEIIIPWPNSFSLETTGEFMLESVVITVDPVEVGVFGISIVVDDDLVLFIE